MTISDGALGVLPISLQCRLAPGRPECASQFADHREHDDTSGTKGAKGRPARRIQRRVETTSPSSLR